MFTQQQPQFIFKCRRPNSTQPISSYEGEQREEESDQSGTGQEAAQQKDCRQREESLRR